MAKSNKFNTAGEQARLKRQIEKGMLKPAPFTPTPGPHHEYQNERREFKRPGWTAFTTIVSVHRDDCSKCRKVEEVAA
jgi:hypothetical protein